MPSASLETALAERALALVDIPSQSLNEAELYAYVKREVDLPLLHDDGESLLYARRSGKPLVVLAGHTDTVPAQGNLPGRIAGGAVHGLGATDMKGGLAVMMELAVLGLRRRPRLRPRAALLPPRRARPRAQPASRRLRGGADARRGGARDLPRADRQHPSARLPREHQRPGGVRGEGGALGAPVARRQRDRAGARRAATGARAEAERRRHRRARVPGGGQRHSDPRRRQRDERDPCPGRVHAELSATRRRGHPRKRSDGSPSSSAGRSRSRSPRARRTSRSTRRSSSTSGRSAASTSSPSRHGRTSPTSPPAGSTRSTSARDRPGTRTRPTSRSRSRSSLGRTRPCRRFLQAA